MASSNFAKEKMGKALGTLCQIGPFLLFISKCHREKAL